MGLAANQARLNMLTLRKNDLESRLLNISNRQLQLATQQSTAAAQKAAALDVFNSQIQEDEEVKVSFTNTAAYADYERVMAELELADSKLTQEQELAQTEYQAITAESEEIEKLIDSNIKKSFKYFD